MKIRGVDFVMLQVSDIVAATEFYRDLLGLRCAIYSAEDRWAEFDCGNVTLVLHGGETVAAGGTGTRVALAVADIDAAHAELDARGARLLSPVQDYGVCRAFEVLDPDGNPLLLHHRADGTFGP
ncbi:VOC family protein [Opitutus terrae]|uniref:Glyoxalase/bleomycin resistance protein/dioxygenase n=1 Tax=Opitutus terrae (strain DSM 11246 / JCM 15787 / PB90-1) TaxID=452637 RepID=B1ZX20_OPITP|nr:VOC family protein [Opitutus terrae]ACB75131.1 Glyoxalase/bleomycin resistance protein/dioxygenase [Opitutus terrae PB90-1]